MSVVPTDSHSQTPDAPSGSSWRTTPMVAVPVAAILIVLLVVAALGVGSSPVCSACHGGQASALAKTAHANVSCASCHFAARGQIASRTDVLFRMVPRSFGGVHLTGAGKLVGDAGCLSCHPKLTSGGIVKKNGLTIDHTNCVTSAPCESCHGDAMHGTAVRYERRPSMNTCIACHTAKDATLSCSACHDQRSASSPNSTPEFVRTHGSDWQKMHGTGDLKSCIACHPASYCRPCHKVDYPHPEDIGTLHGALARNVGVDSCLTCHKNISYCNGCHSMEMPHPAGFLQAHSKIATSVGDPRCSTCHVVSDCVQCHVYHVHPGGPTWVKPNGGRQ